MYVEAILIAILIGIFRNGRLEHFSSQRFKGMGIVLFAFLLYLSPFLISILGGTLEMARWAIFSAMGLVALVTLLNFREAGMKFIALGLLLNLVVMGIHGASMPISENQMMRLGYGSFVSSLEEEQVVNYISMDQSDSLFKWLGKWIPFPSFYPFARVFSPGDLFIHLGVMVFIQNKMLLLSMRTHGSMLKFSYKSPLK